MVELVWQNVRVADRENLMRLLSGAVQRSCASLKTILDERIPLDRFEQDPRRRLTAASGRENHHLSVQ
jgi:hypothetical protein